MLISFFQVGTIKSYAMRIFVKTAENVHIALEVEPTDRIEDVYKEK